MEDIIDQINEVVQDASRNQVDGSVAIKTLKNARDAILVSRKTSLATLLTHQRELMTVLGIPEGKVTNILTDPLYKDVLIMMGGEVSEALEPLTLATKPWKRTAVDLVGAVSHAKEELIDTFFFFLEACELVGLTAEDIATIYENKRQRNLVRAAGQGRDAVEAFVSGKFKAGDEVKVNVFAAQMAGTKLRLDHYLTKTERWVVTVLEQPIVNDFNPNQQGTQIEVTGEWLLAVAS